MSKKQKKKQERQFKPYVGQFFSFKERIKKNPKLADIGRNIYSNYLMDNVSMNDIPERFLVIDEKQNFVRIFIPKDTYIWTRKTQIVPAELPYNEDNEELKNLNFLKTVRSFLIYCTETKLKDFSLECMTEEAIAILAKVAVLIKAEENKNKKH